VTRSSTPATTIRKCSILDRDRWRALGNAVKNLRVPYNAGNFLTSWKPVRFSRRTIFQGVSKQCSILSTQFAKYTELLNMSKPHL
jgi:hypothetical protein